MNEIATVVLGVLAIMIPILGLLIAALYSNIKESHKELKVEVALHKVDNEKQLEDAVKEAKEAVTNAEHIHINLWSEINKIKDRHHEIDTHHKTLCQKHDDHFDRIDEHIVTLESKIKGDGMFFNQRLKELDHDIQFERNRITKLELKKENNGSI